MEDLELAKKEEWLGTKVAELLGVKLNHGRYDTTWGRKNALGLGRSVMKLVEEGGLIEAD